jgi:hypothetical protein
MDRRSLWISTTLAGAALVSWATTVSPAQIGWSVVPRDAFPVFDNPRMLTAAEAEARSVIFDRDMVIGVAHGREAKAYPITIMGVHELGNDTIGGVPIAVTW